MVTILHEQASVTIGALAANTAILDAGPEYDSNAPLQATFLTKKIEVNIAVRNVTEGDVVQVFMARGDKGISDIKTALETAFPDGPRDADAAKEESNAIFKTWFLTPTGNAQGSAFINESFNFGGKGIPMLEDTGWVWGVYNPRTSAITTGGNMIVFARHYGAWLDA